MTPRVLITGASGFVGKPLLAALGARKIDARGVYRKPPTDVLDATSVIGEVSTRFDWSGACDGVDCVVHMADGLKQFEGQQGNIDRPSPAMTESIDASLKLADDAFRAGVTIFVYVSSFKAMAGECEPSVLTEANLAEPTSLYGRMKLELERRLEAAAQSQNARLVIIRPPIVYGPGVGGNFLKLLRLADTPWPLPFGGMNNARSMICVENLVDALVTVVASPEDADGVYLIHDGPALAMPELIGHLRRGLGRPRRLIHVPGLKRLAILSALRPAVERLTGSLALNDAKFRREYNWRPPTTAEAALVETAAHHARNR